MQTKAFDALLSAEARGAFQIDREDPITRDRYGRHIHGQCLLMARRLVESGVPLVTVNWHDDRQNYWDTHVDNFNHLKNRLMPPTDRGLSALLDDLAARGMLDETLVVWVGEFGRNPRITRANAGREHWPRCYSALLAGGGVQGGLVYGSSDRWAAYPASDPVSPADLAATILHALGIDPATEVIDPVGRPLPINRGTPVTEILA
jgi:arylsulfatase A-like enzyme